MRERGKRKVIRRREKIDEREERGIGKETSKGGQQTGKWKTDEGEK